MTRLGVVLLLCSVSAALGIPATEKHPRNQRLPRSPDGATLAEGRLDKAGILPNEPFSPITPIPEYPWALEPTSDSANADIESSTTPESLLDPEVTASSVRPVLPDSIPSEFPTSSEQPAPSNPEPTTTESSADVTESASSSINPPKSDDSSYTPSPSPPAEPFPSENLPSPVSEHANSSETAAPSYPTPSTPLMPNQLPSPKIPTLPTQWTPSQNSSPNNPPLNAPYHPGGLYYPSGFGGYPSPLPSPGMPHSPPMYPPTQPNQAVHQPYLYYLYPYGWYYTSYAPSSVPPAVPSSPPAYPPTYPQNPSGQQPSTDLLPPKEQVTLNSIYEAKQQVLQSFVNLWNTIVEVSKDHQRMDVHKNAAPFKV